MGSQKSLLETTMDLVIWTKDEVQVLYWSDKRCSIMLRGLLRSALNLAMCAFQWYLWLMVMTKILSSFVD